MKAIIFDFDGVIVDSEKYWIELDEGFFPAIAQGYTEDHARQMMGLGRMAGYDYLVQTLGLTLSYEDYCESLEEHVREIYFTKCQLLPGARELIEAVRAAGRPLAIASSSRRKWIDGTLARFGMADLFDAISTADEVHDRTKPLPDVYLHAAGQLHVEPANCIAIEDSRNGIAAAKAAGMFCYGLRTDMSKEQDLSAADRIVTSLREIDLGAL